MTIILLNTGDLEVRGALYGPQLCGECSRTIDIAGDASAPGGWWNSGTGSRWSGIIGRLGDIGEVSQLDRSKRHIGIAPCFIVLLAVNNVFHAV